MIAGIARGRSIPRILGAQGLFVASTLLANALLTTTASAQIPPVKPITSPKLPSITLPTLTQVLVMDTPNFNTANPFSLAPGQQARVRAQLSASFTANIGVQLRYTANVLIGPVSVTIPAGALFADFMVTALPATQQASGSVRGWTTDSTTFKTAVLSVVPATACANPTPTLLPSRTSVPGNSSITITVSMSCTSTVTRTVQVTSSIPGAIPSPPGNVITIAANANSGQYTTTTGNVTATTVVTLSAFVTNSNPIARAPDMQVAVTRP